MRRFAKSPVAMVLVSDLLVIEGIPLISSLKLWSKAISQLKHFTRSNA